MLLPRITVWLTIALVSGLWLCPSQPTDAHPELATSVRHRGSIAVGPKNVDVTLELTIGEIPSFAERLLMDEDRDGKITASEVETYLDEQSETLQQAVSLSIAGQPLELLFLYDPEIELGSNDTTTAAHLVIRLFYFARSPVGFQAGDQLVLEDRLWSHAPSLGSYHVSGLEGVEFVAEKTASILWTTPADKKPLEMHARCLAAPGDANRGGQAKHSSESTIETKVAISTSMSVGLDDLEKLTDFEIERPQQEPSAARLTYSWLFSLGVAVLIASAVAVLTSRTHRSEEES